MNNYSGSKLERTSLKATFFMETGFSLPKVSEDIETGGIPETRHVSRQKGN